MLIAAMGRMGTDKAPTGMSRCQDLLLSDSSSEYKVAKFYAVAWAVRNSCLVVIVISLEYLIWLANCRNNNNEVESLRWTLR